MKSITGLLVIFFLFIVVKSCNLVGTEKAKGKVLHVNPDLPGSKLGGRLAQPIIRFTYKDSLYTLEDYDVTFFNSYSVGDDACVYFPEHEPAEAKPYGLVAYWLTIPSLCIFGLLCMLWMGMVNIITGQVKGYR